MGKYQGVFQVFVLSPHGCGHVNDGNILTSPQKIDLNDKVQVLLKTTVRGKPQTIPVASVLPVQGKEDKKVFLYRIGFSKGCNLQDGKVDILLFHLIGEGNLDCGCLSLKSPLAPSTGDLVLLRKISAPNDPFVLLDGFQTSTKCKGNGNHVYYGSLKSFNLF